MTDKPTRLGRGLAALIGDMASLEGARVTESGSGGKKLPLEFIIPNRANPRRTFNDEQLEELTNSIREKGVMSPLLVRPTDDPNIFELIAGERRWRASQKAGLHDVPVIVRDVDDKEALELAIIENVQRADLNPLEEAMGYGQLIEQFEYTQQDLAQVIGKSRSHVANTLRLLKLPEDVRGMVSSGTLTAGHARTLITVEDPTALAQEIVEKGLSVREAEALSQQRDLPAKKPVVGRTDPDTDTLALQRRLADALGLTVALSHSEKGGKLEIRYKTLEQLDDICMRLTGRSN
jgi:ParB family chromosome partitioning protein